MAILSGVGGRAVGVVASPRATFEAVARAPRWMGILMLTFVMAAASAAIVLETDIGQLALLDQWERTAAAFGRDLDEAEYAAMADRSEEHTSELQSQSNLVCRLLLEKKKKKR